MIQKLYLVARECLSGFFLSLVVMAAITLSVVVTGFFVLSGQSVRSYITERFSGNINPDTIIVSPAPGKTIFLFEFRDDGRPLLDRKALERIRAMDGVRRVYPLLSVDVPVQATVSFMGYTYGTDLPALGVPLAMLEDDLKDRSARREWNSADTGEKGGIPVAVPLSVLQAYNESMAPANRMPRLSRESVMGLRFQLTIGRSSIRTSGGYYDTRARLVAFPSNINTMALLIPEKTARRINDRFGTRPREYVGFHVKTRDHKALLKVSDSIRSMGYQVDVDRGISKNILELQETINGFTGMIVRSVALLALIAAGFSAMISVFNRLYYYRVLRTVGASWAFLSLSILVKYCLLGLTASVAGILVIRYIMNSMVPSLWMVPGLTLAVPDRRFVTYFLMAGTLLPAMAAVPALLFLRFRALNRD